MDAYDYVTSFKVCEFTKNINLSILWKKHFFSWFIYYMLMAVIWEKINIGGNHQHFETISVNWNVEAILLPTMKKELVCLEKRPMEFFFGKAFEKMYCILIVFYEKMTPRRSGGSDTCLQKLKGA